MELTFGQPRKPLTVLKLAQPGFDWDGEARVNEARVNEARVDEARVDEARVKEVGDGAGGEELWARRDEGRNAGAVGARRALIADTDFGVWT